MPVFIICAYVAYLAILTCTWREGKHTFARFHNLFIRTHFYNPNHTCELLSTRVAHDDLIDQHDYGLSLLAAALTLFILPLSTYGPRGNWLAAYSGELSLAICFGILFIVIGSVIIVRRISATLRWRAVDALAIPDRQKVLGPAVVIHSSFRLPDPPERSIQLADRHTPDEYLSACKYWLEELCVHRENIRSYHSEAASARADLRSQSIALSDALPVGLHIEETVRRCSEFARTAGALALKIDSELPDAILKEERSIAELTVNLQTAHRHLCWIDSTYHTDFAPAATQIFADHDQLSLLATSKAPA